MYCEHFGFRCRPFEETSDARSFFATAELEETLAAMEYQAHYGRGLGLVVGDAGMGKTLLAHALLERLHATDRVAMVTCRIGGDVNVIRETARAFGVKLASPTGRRRTIAKLVPVLTEHAHAAHRSILIIDQAESLGARGMVHVAALQELCDDAQPLLHIVLLGQPQFRTVLSRPEFARIRQQVFGERSLVPLTTAEVRAYIQHRLAWAGAADTSLFDASAFDAIHAASNGTPRMINRICDASLVAAYGANQRRVTGEIVDDVIDDAARTPPTHPRSCADAEPAARPAEPGSASPLPGLRYSLRAAGDVRPQADPSDAASGGAMPNRASLESAPARAPDTARAAPAPGASDARSAGPLPTRVVGALAPATDDDVRRGDARPGAVDPSMERFVSHGAAQLRRQEVLAGSIESLLRSGEHLAERLERAVREAGRAAVTQETSLGQYTAIEQHLASLTARAQQLSLTLTTAVERATGSVDTLARRSDELADVAASRLDTLERRTAQVAESGDAVERRLNQLDAACTHAGDVEAKLVAFADGLAERAEQSQERIALLMTGLESSQNVHARLEALVRQATAIADETETAMNARHAALKETLTRCERVRTDLAEQGIERYKAELDEAMRAAERQHADTVKEAVEAQRSGLRALIEESDAQQRRTQDVVSAARAEAREALEAFDTDRKARLHEGKAAADKLAAKLQTLIDVSASQTRRVDAELEGRTKQLHGLETSAASLHTDIERAHAMVAAAKETADRLKPEVKALTCGAEQSVRDIKSVLERGEALLVGVHEASGRLTILQEHTAKTLVDLGAASERATEINTRTRRCDELADRLESLRREGQRTAEQLGERAERAGTLCDTVQRVLADARQTAAALGSHNAAATGTLKRLSDAGTTGTNVAQGLNETMRSIDERVAARRAEVEATMQTAAAATKQMHELLSDVATRRTEAQAIVAEVTTQLKRLRQAADVTTTTLERLDSGRDEVNQHAGQVQAAAAKAGAMYDKIEQRIRDVWSLTSTTEQRAKALTLANTKAEQLVERLAAATEPADRHCTQLTLQTRHADEQARRLSECTGEASRLMQRVGGAARTLATARRISTALEQTVQRAAGINAELVETLCGAADRVVEASAARDAARSAAATQQEVRDDAEALLERLSSARTDSERTLADLTSAETSALQVVNDLNEHAPELARVVERTEVLMPHVMRQETAVQAAERLLQELRTQAETMTAHLGELHARARDIEETLARATDEPAKVVERAHAQAAQLDTVCSVVRKVFAGLSRTTLQANEQQIAFQRTTDGAVARITQIVGETDRATNTLCAWVEEAARVQTRLANTLQACPTIAATHPPDALSRLTATFATPVGRDAAPDTDARHAAVSPFRGAGAESDRGASAPTGPGEIKRVSKARSGITPSPAARSGASATSTPAAGRAGEPEAAIPTIPRPEGRPPSRADEIAEIIADAKQAAPTPSDP
ncbi:MAG: AAA family ATPase [Phycisphaerae bacterium]